ncbi:unnamed protein product [Trifolium pratense]|uniref:Uncharacterized protein n=1 Tax=Trifolium pratense TaxID=57577 RepID=A0ACB0L9N7_TRIPR|nr:unnamed protein product [Trifolium pratense]
MASSSQQLNTDTGDENVLNVPPSPPPQRNTVLSPVRDDTTVARGPETDPRDGRETSLSSDEEDVEALTDRRLGKRLQFKQEAPANNAEQPAVLANSEIAALIAALKQTTEAMQAQNRRLDEQSERIAALEKSRPPRKTNSPPRRRQADPSPPRPAAVKHRRPDLERVEVTPRKKDRTPPHREGRSSPGKKGKHEAPRRHSPQGLALMSKQGMSSSYRPRGYKSRSPTPMPGDSPRSSEDHSPNGSDEGDPRCPLSADILRKRVPKGFERPPTLPAYDGLTDPDDHIANVNANLDFRNISGAIRCRLFPTTLRKGAMAWYQSLPPQSIHSWRDLTEQFSRHFTASRKHPKTVHALEAIYQAEEETLRNFVESAVVQRRRRQSPEKAEAAEKAVKDLLEANFISEARYTTWLSNVVLVKKSNGKWRMCVDYTDLNRACPKDSYPLPCIDKLVDNSSGFKLLSFMDAYSGYNQIPMAVADRGKTAFMTESGNYYYNVMPFGLKNAGATYQRMMNKVFRAEIGDMLEVYMDDMIVKSHEEIDHTAHLRKVFEQARKHNMRFNPEKCTFGVRAGKFLGFYLTERGIEANPDKCRAFTELPTPSNKKSIQTLNGMLTSLSRFVAKSAQHALPLFKLLRKEAVFEWTDECEQALQHLKKALSEPPVLSRPDVEEVLYIYLSVASEAVSAALVRETTEGQKPVYFTSKALQGPELRYTQIEKVALALINAARRLRHYFLAHTIIVRTDQPIKSLLGRPDMAGRMLKWSLELSEFDIRYESRKALKSQVLADFVAEMTSPASSTNEADKWTIFVDGASSSTGAGAGIILENENGIIIEVSLALSFPTSNNQAEYEAFLAGLRLAEDMEAKEVKIFTDSQLVASQVLGEYQAKNDNLSEYLALVKEKITKFESVEVQHVPREHNKRADILSKLASTKKKGGNKSVIQEVLPRPSIEKASNVLDINVIGDQNCWMTPVYNFLANGTLPDDQKEAAIIRRRACAYVVLDGKLYRRGFSIPLLKCVDEETVDYILREVHEGINAQHLGGRSLARKALRAGYYWPTMQQDAKDHVKKCDKCQRHGDMHLAPPHELKSMSSPWPFAWWGMDILGPFTKGLHQNKFLIVAVDYFTKWVEAEPLSDITSFRILRFFKRDVLCRFGIPQAVVTDNGTQFTDKGFQDFLAALGTKQHFTSVEHPQTNGQAEAANRVILRGLRRRLDQNKKKWVEELESVLWAYRTTPHSTTGETPFRMVYGTEAVIPVEVGEPSRRTEQPLEEEMNDEALREELDLVEEIRTGASLREATLKQKIAARHDVKVIKREFEVGSLVLRRNAKDSQDGKLAANWEGPYRVIDKTENGAYYLEDLRGKKLPRPWNAQKLKQYYS